MSLAGTLSPIRMVDTPTWRLTWSGTDVTTDIAAHVTSLTVTDHKEGASDEVAVVLEDRDGRWRNGWFPAKGASLDLAFGYRGAPLVDAGRFTVDELEADGPPDKLSVRAIAAGIDNPLRTSRHKGYEGKTLGEIAKEIADQHGMTVVGDPVTEPLKRVSQSDETDLKFLARLAAEHGYVFSVRGSMLVFVLDADLLAADPILTLSRGDHDPVRWRFRVTAKQVYGACEVTYQNPRTKSVDKVTVKATDTDETGAAKPKSADILKKRIRVESPEDAERKAKALLERANRGEVTAHLTVPGDPRICAAANVLLTGFGAAWDGKYHVTTSTHRLSRGGGYATEMEAFRVV